MLPPPAPQDSTFIEVTFAGMMNVQLPVVVINTIVLDPDVVVETVQLAADAGIVKTPLDISRKIRSDEI
jgi:hypothetical protein